MSVHITPIKEEESILEEGFRALIISEINGTENKARKAEAIKRFDILKDSTKKYVEELLIVDGLSQDTIREMRARTPNISIGKKIIDKKSQVYRDGAERTAFVGGKINEDAQDQVDVLSDVCNMNTQMKKTNKILEAQKNCIVQVEPVFDFAKNGFKPKVKPLHPQFYDVIPDWSDQEQARVVIFSNPSRDTKTTQALEGSNLGGDRRRIVRTGNEFREGDGVKQIIADSPSDEGVDGEFIWWSSKFHFTTDAKGKVIPRKSPEDLLNPIQVLPFVNFALDQDGSFWAVGGGDIFEGAVLINLILADLYYIAKVQGMGLFYMFGTNVPETVKWGPTNAITGTLDKDDPSVQIGFASSNPPLNDHMAIIEQFIALLLTTNNLEPGTVQGKLSATSANSGIQEIIRRSEISGDIENQKELFRDNEPEIFNLKRIWFNLYFDLGLLTPDLMALGRMPDDLIVKTQFKQAETFMSEKEKLEVIKTRLELKLDSMVDALQRDDGSLTQSEAKEKLKRILEDKLEESRQSMARFIIDKETSSDDVDPPKDGEDADNEEQDDIQA